MHELYSKYHCLLKLENMSETYSYDINEKKQMNVRKRLLINMHEPHCLLSHVEPLCILSCEPHHEKS